MATTLERVQSIVTDRLGVDAEQVVPEAEFIGDLNADSLDLVEVNPALDIRNATAELATELALSALGKNIL